MHNRFGKVATAIVVTTITAALMWGDWMMIPVGIVVVAILAWFSLLLSRFE